MTRRAGFLAITISILSLGPTVLNVRSAYGQDAVPFELLARTIPIIAAPDFAPGRPVGTAFMLDDSGRRYLVTARHVVANLPTCNGQMQAFLKGRWVPLRVRQILFPESSDADVAVLDIDSKADDEFTISATSRDGSDGPTFGQQLWFLGYPLWSVEHPHGISSSFDAGTKLIPFIKRGTLSAIDGSNPKSVVLYIDGFNNVGFSGGPIVYWSFSARAYRILGVVRGYLYDPAALDANGQKVQVDVNGEKVDVRALSNSGILVGYSIAHAIESIAGAKLVHKCKDDAVR